MANPYFAEAAQEARGGSALGFPPPPNQPGLPREAWRDHLELWNAELDRQKLLTEREKLRIEGLKIDAQWRIESSKTAFEYAKGAIGHAILINGGAAIAILAHLGTASKNEAALRVPTTLLALPLRMLGAGLVCACLCGATAYVSQLAFTDRLNRLGETLRVIALLSWLGSIGLFAYAVWLAAQAVR